MVRPYPKNKLKSKRAGGVTQAGENLLSKCEARVQIPHPPKKGKRWAEEVRPGTHVWVSITEELVEHVAELPTQHGVAGQRQPVDHRPKGLRPLLMVGAQDAWCGGQGK
jgi:hypothetical protein